MGFRTTGGNRHDESVGWRGAVENQVAPERVTDDYWSLADSFISALH